MQPDRPMDHTPSDSADARTLKKSLPAGDPARDLLHALSARPAALQQVPQPPASAHKNQVDWPCSVVHVAERNGFHQTLLLSPVGHAGASRCVRVTMRIAFFTDGVDTPGARFRVEQFLAGFRAHGIECTQEYGYGTSYNRIAHGRYAIPYKLACRAKRAFVQLKRHDADLVFLQRPALPQTGLIEQLGKLTGQRLIIDFDDAIHLGPDGKPSAVRARAFHQATAAAVHLIAGNEHLASVAGSPEKTTIIPTVIDTDVVIPSSPANRDRVVVGWMGTSTNFANLVPALPGIERLLRSHPHVHFRIVSNARLPEASRLPRTEQIPWSRASELGLLQSFDVGVMPLLDTPLMRGKCAFKMIQYMAAGRPAVGSSVGANIPLLAGTNAGALVPPHGDWCEALRPYVEDAGLRRSAGEAARDRVVAAYSIRAVLDTYLQLFQRLVAQ